MSLGVHFALTAAEVRRLRAIKEPDELFEYITGTLEESHLAEGAWAFQSDKSWEAIHRCLGDGQLLYETGPFPLAYAVLGGASLDAGDDYTACLLTPRQVRDTSEALDRVTKAWFRGRYQGLASTQYRRYMSDEDLEYTWENFKGLRVFFRRAASAGRAVLFTTDA
ncbi:MAG: YfbM family protein [Polyangiaceae bacterium]|jgi:hypothetical protein|nr:YfbM family protein [Polyangiaceae bacterium]